MSFLPCGPGEMVKVGEDFVFNGYGNEVPNSEVPGVSTAIHRHPMLVPKTIGTPPAELPGVHPAYPEVNTTEKAWQHGVQVAGDGPCLGWRPAAATAGEDAGDYTYISYNTADQIATDFGRGLIVDDLCPPAKYEEDAAQAAVVASGGKGLAYVKERVGVAPGDDFHMRTLGFFMINQPTWVLACQACNKHTITTVPLYATLGPNAVEFSINMLQLKTVIADTRAAAKLIKLVNGPSAPPSLKCIIVVQQGDPRVAVDAAEMAKLVAAAGSAVQVVTFHDVQAHGAALDDAAVAALGTSVPKPLDCATISFTSGTTGDPKGAMLSHANLVATASAVSFGEIPLGPQDVHLSYLPLAHIFERVMTEALLCGGARIGFIQGPTKKFLLKDLGVLHPTIFPSVPRLYNMIYDKTMAAVAGGTACKSGLFNKALDAKVQWLKEGYVTHKFWDTLIFSKIKAKFGLDRIRCMITGAAPIPSHVIEFLRCAFCCPVIEGYGQTESAAASFIQRQADTSFGHVGCPVLCSETMLVSTDTPPYKADETDHKGQPCKGRGEICFRGPGVFIGYYKNAQKTADAIDDDGWLHSGDIGIWLENGALRIVDRKKNIFKTTRGEYIAPEKIENTYLKCPLVEKMWVYGDSMHTEIMAVVHPSPASLYLWAKDGGAPVPEWDFDTKKPATDAQMKAAQVWYEAKCDDDAVNAAITEQMKALASGPPQVLYTFEQPKYIFLEPREWIAEGAKEDMPTGISLLTETFKMKRATAKTHYLDIIKAFYEREEPGAAMQGEGESASAGAATKE